MLILLAFLRIAILGLIIGKGNTLSNWKEMYEWLSSFCKDESNPDIQTCKVCIPILVLDVSYYWIADFLPLMIIAMMVNVRERSDHEEMCSPINYRDVFSQYTRSEYIHSNYKSIKKYFNRDDGSSKKKKKDKKTNISSWVYG